MLGASMKLSNTVTHLADMGADVRAKKVDLPIGGGSFKQREAYLAVETYLRKNLNHSLERALLATGVNRDHYLKAKKLMGGSIADSLPVPKPKIAPKFISNEPEFIPNKLWDKETLWQNCVAAAKKRVKEIHASRLAITKIALACCDIRQGGGAHWNDFEGIYTLKGFAKEIGMNYKTLQNWTVAFRFVPGLEEGEYQEEDYKFAHRAVTICGRGADRAKLIEEFRKQRDGAKSVYKLGTIIEWARSHYNFVSKASKADLASDDLSALRTICERTIDAIDEKLK